MADLRSVLRTTTFFVLIALAALPYAQGSPVSWRSTTAYPTGVYGQSCVISSGYIYCVGGSDTAKVYFASVSSSGVGTWTATTSYPLAVLGDSCVANSGYIYCVGGRSADVYYAPLSNTGVGTWTKTTSYPAKAFQQPCVAFSGHIICVGLSPTAPVHWAYSASLSSSGVGEWVKTTGYPIGDVPGSCVVGGPAGDYIYCVGGYFENPLTFPTDEVYSAHLSADGGVGSWVKVSPYPTRIRFESCVTHVDRIYCVAGATTFHETDTVYFADPTVDGGLGTWTATTSYPIPIESESCATTPGLAIYCVGGFTTTGATTQVYWTL